MTTMLITFNGTRENGNFCGDQLSYLKIAHLFVQNERPSKVLMSMSPGNEMHLLWTRFLREYDVEVVYDVWNAGDWPTRWDHWDKWRRERHIEGREFDTYRELYLRIHGAQRQSVLCGHERGQGRRNIFEYVCAGQENQPDVFPGSDVYDVEVDHSPPTRERDVYISPHCKTQGNYVFTFEYWERVVRALVGAGVSVTVGYHGYFCDDLIGPLYWRHWGDHRAWMEQVCSHKLVACGNTGTGWLAAACGTPLLTMEPHNSVMADHRYRECGLRNLVEVIDGHKLDEMRNDMMAVADYCSERIAEFCRGRPASERVVLSRRLEDVCRRAVPYSVNPYEKLRVVATEMLSVAHLPGDVADLGSYRGGSALILRQLAPDKHLHLFDTWEGNPYDDPLCHHKRGEWGASMVGCQELVGDDELTRYHRGVFPGSLRHPASMACTLKRFSFVYVDMDTEQATKDAIEFFWPRMVPGGKLVIDDYDWEPCAGVKKAVDEWFFGDEKRVDGTKSVNQAVHTCILGKV